MADRFVAQFPLADRFGYSATEIVVAVEGGKPVTFERSRLKSEGYKRTTATFVWSTVEVALSVALNNAGFGHTNDSLMRQSQIEVTARMDGEADDTMLFIGGYEPPVKRAQTDAEMTAEERAYALTDGWVTD